MFIFRTRWFCPLSALAQRRSVAEDWGWGVIPDCWRKDLERGMFYICSVSQLWGRAVVLGALQVTGSGHGQGRHGRLAQSSGAVAASPATVLGHLDSGQCRPHRNKSFIVLNFCQQIKNFHNETFYMGAGCIVRAKQRGSPTL